MLARHRSAIYSKRDTNKFGQFLTSTDTLSQPLLP